MSLIRKSGAELQAAPTEELRAILSVALQATADSLAYLAAVWQELERRGEDLSELARGVGRFLPRIAATEVKQVWAGQAMEEGTPSARTPADRPRARRQGGELNISGLLVYYRDSSWPHRSPGTPGMARI